MFHYNIRHLVYTQHKPRVMKQMHFQRVLTCKLFTNCYFLRSFQHLILIFLLNTLAGLNYGFAQEHNTRWHASLVDSLCKKLSETYIYPEHAKQMCVMLKKNLRKYSGISDPAKLANTITIDLQSINNDKHLSLYYNPAEVAELKQKRSDNAGNSKVQARLLAALKEWNFGFRDTRILNGNIGYLNLMAFTEFVDEADGTLTASMQFLQNTDAIIIDLRRNGGGSPKMVARVASYFLEAGIHLNSIYSRISNDTVKTFTSQHISGKHRTKVPLYLLVGKNTVSAAEEFSYVMKNLKRATLVGHITRGAANPATDFPVGDSFIINVPFGRGINPVTGTNWSGVGVQPDIECAETNVLEVAHTAVLKELGTKTTDPYAKQSLSFYTQVNQFSLDGDKIYGCERSGDSVRFTFNPREYYLPSQKITSIAVISHFSEWNPSNRHGRMQKVGSTYSLTIPNDNMGLDDYIPFQFVVNGNYYVTPPLRAKNKLLAGPTGKEPYLYVLNN
ncbi:hypothetical protein EXU57_08895 [Segetibacter sp. 3557_3]|uniref:S41 family peptidase n=1 Tax=Segetibacter sp. 3557_3 TaxID=2547429 RepID=UPI001058D381|nr:S41 family peptidase [Segetibacter sp. 3557_3]TDH26912.1 hypothetical protein EXU57_08895 [Segetibacter sp. 3557_3]